MTLTKKQQNLLVQIMRAGSVAREDIKHIYSNQRSFYTAIKFLKDMNLVKQEGGKKDRDNAPSYSLTLDGMIFTIMLASLKLPPDQIKEKMDI